VIGLRSETARRIKSSAFCCWAAECRLRGKYLRKPSRRAKWPPERLPRQRLVLFRDNRPAKLMQKIHRLTDN
jgi:hypothetical protein